MGCVACYDSYSCLDGHPGDSEDFDPYTQAKLRAVFLMWAVLCLGMFCRGDYCGYTVSLRHYFALSFSLVSTAPDS